MSNRTTWDYIPVVNLSKLWRILVALVAFSAVIVFNDVSSPRRATALANLTFNSCNSTQQTQIQQAFLDAQTMATNASTYFDHNMAGNRYTYWFGSFNQVRYSAVRTAVTSIRDAMLLTNPAKGDCSGTNCSAGTFGYVYSTDITRTFYACSEFWNAPATGTDSRAGTLVEQFSTFTSVASTITYAFGQTSSHSLASSNVNQAISNADNYEYFFENTPATADAAPAYTYSISTADFGTHDVGTTEFARVVTITNWGDSSLNVAAITLTGEFSMSSGCSNAVIPALSSCAITVTFTPVSAGVKTGSLTVASNATVSPGSVSFTATATTPTPPTTTTVPATTTTTSPAVPVVASTSTGQLLTIKGKHSGSRLTLSGTNPKSLQGKLLTIQRLSGNKWVKIGTTKTKSSTWTWTSTQPKGSTYRALLGSLVSVKVRI